MKALAIIGLVFGGTAPILLLLPLIIAPFGGDDYMQVGWAFFFFTIPAGILLMVVGTILAIIAAGLSLSRGVSPKAVAIVGIVLAGCGVLIEPIGILSFISGWGEVVSLILLGLGIALSLTGVIMCAVSGLRSPRRR